MAFILLVVRFLDLPFKAVGLDVSDPDVGAFIVIVGNRAEDNNWAFELLNNGDLVPLGG